MTLPWIILLLLTLITIKRAQRLINIHFCNSKSHKKQQHLALLIPILFEKKIIKETIEFYKKIERKIDIIYVTSEVEGKQKNSSYLQLKKELYNSTQKIIHCSKKRKGKAVQLNYAFQKIKGKYDYVGIFDADSRPDHKGLISIIRGRYKADLIQMPSIYDAQKTKGWQAAVAVFQTTWSFIFEIPHWHHNLL